MYIYTQLFYIFQEIKKKNVLYFIKSFLQHH